MRIALSRAAGALLLVGGGALAEEVETSAADAAPPPFELTRSLQALQDQIAIGSEAATSAQRALLIHIGEQFLAADPELWREPANARAAIVYVLSGGRPQLLHKLIQEENLPPTEADLARGALAYATGRRDEARALLEDVDARALPASVGAHIALVQASLTMDSDPEIAVGHLETARLLAPGTLVEEAALRRQLSVESALADAESFMALARQYFRRFPHSVYASNFLRAFPKLWADLDMPATADSFAKLEATVAGLEPEDRRALYLSLAHDRLLAGDTETAGLVAIGASEIAGADSTAAARAGLYSAAAGVAGKASALALEALEALDPALLSGADAELHAAALAVAGEVQRPSDAAPRLDVDQGVDPGDLEAAEVLEQARQTLAAADALLERTR